MEKLFVYGTLRDKNVQKEVIGRVVEGYPDVLVDYKKSEIVIDREVYPIVFPEKNSEAEGLVLEVTKEELKKIDEYEGVSYLRIIVNLKSEGKAWVFVKA